MPEHAATDNGGEIDLGGETATVLLIGQKIGGEGEPTPGQHRDQTLAATRTDQAIEGHGGDMVEDGTQF
jgi:hypothetical protein